MNDSNPHLKHLNSQQRKAATTTDGPLRIIAGAGAGKTRTLTARIAHLITRGVHPESILAITFTNKAANEMQDRVRGVIDTHTTKPKADANPFVSTFHALGVHMLREFGEHIDIDPQFTIIDQKQGRRLIKRAIEAESLDPDTWSPKQLQATISAKKSEGVRFRDFQPDERSQQSAQILQRVWRRYHSSLKEQNGCDFDDLLLEPVRLLETADSVRSRLQDRFEYLHIDEYQDTNRTQYQLARLLATPQNNICVVGDSDQTIYTWRGAEIRNILDFERDFPDAKTVRLEQNYRSTQTILAAADDIIAENDMRDEKTLFTDNKEGEPLPVIRGYTAADEAGRVVKQIQTLIDDGADTDEIAVLYRTNFQSRVLEDAFLKRNVPYQILGTRFFDRKEIRDALAYMRLAQNPSVGANFDRVINTPRRGIGEKTQERIREDRLDELSARRKKKVDDFWQKIEEIQQVLEEKPAAAAVADTLEISGLKSALKEGDKEAQERWENLQELVSMASRYDELEPPSGIAQLLENAALRSEQDNLDEEAGSVSLMTVHAAKGLEFDYVFITGLEQGLFPQERDDESQESAEEERRLMYVALTRARERAFLSYAQTRRIYGSKETQLPAEFIDNISDELKDKQYGQAEGGEDDVELLDIEF